jgi:hypothetical protein
MVPGFISPSAAAVESPYSSSSSSSSSVGDGSPLSSVTEFDLDLDSLGNRIVILPSTKWFNARVLHGVIGSGYAFLFVHSKKQSEEIIEEEEKGAFLERAIGAAQLAGMWPKLEQGWFTLEKVVDGGKFCSFRFERPPILILDNKAKSSNITCPTIRESLSI